MHGIIAARQELGRPQTFITNIETGERRVDVIEPAEICRAYGKRVVEFVKGLES